MCTAITYKPHDHYFGRTLDLDRSYGEKVVITPRNYPFRFLKMGEMPRHYALIGMAHLAEGVPLYYEATNEMGLSMAGLHFPHSACYPGADACQDELAVWELIPWVLGQCADTKEARALLGRVGLSGAAFGKELAAAPLHWLVADRDGAFAAEPLAEGLVLTEDPAGVLANEPPLACQLAHLAGYLGLSAGQPANTFAPGLALQPVSLGLGAVGLPGDFSSPSRFVRAAFVRGNAVCGPEEEEAVHQVFHILGAVEQPRGCVHPGQGQYHHTRYTCCCNTDRGTYYYTTYGNRQLCAVELYRENLDAAAPVAYPLVQKGEILWLN